MDELEEYEVNATPNQPEEFTDYPGPPDIPASTGKDEHGEYGEDFEEESDGDYAPTFEISVTEALTDITNTLDDHAQTLEALKTGVNTIGEMMNGVAQAFDQIMTEIQKGGVAGLLGTLMGGKKSA